MEECREEAHLLVEEDLLECSSKCGDHDLYEELILEVEEALYQLEG